MANTINCPVCGKLTDSRLDSCPHCGGYLKSRRQKQAQPAAAKARKTCPRCGSGVQEGDIICVACGTNLLTGQKIVDEARLRQRQRTIPMGWIIGGIAAAVLIIVVGFLWIYAVTRDPLSQARRLAEDGRTMDAINLLQEYVERVPNHAPATMELARQQWNIQQFDDAAINFAKVVQLDPQNRDAAIFAARAAARSGIASPRELAELLERAAALEQDDAGLWYTLALARGAAGNNAGAIEALQRVIELRATDDSAHLAMGVTQGLSGNVEVAETEFLTVGPGERKAEALAGLGFLALLKGNTAEAPRRLSEAAAAGPLPAAAQVNLALGRLQLEQGAFAEAQSSLETALAADPQNRHAQFLHGLCLQARGRPQEALVDFETLMNTPGDFASEAAIQAADIHISLNVLDRARRALDAAARAGSKPAAFFTAQGRLALASQDEEGALSNFDTAVRTDPSYAGAYLERGLVHIRRDAIAQGLADLDTYLKLVGDGGAGTRIEEVRALADQLRQAGQPESTQIAREGGE